MNKLVLTVVVALASATTVARAQEMTPEKRAEAERFFRAGERAFDAGQYDVAAQAFEEAYSRLPLPAIAFSAAQAYRLQYFIDKDPPKLKRAVALYRAYLEAVDKGGRRDDAAANLAELEPILQRMEAEQARAGMGPIEDRPTVEVTTQLMVSTQVETAVAAIDGGEPGAVPLVREVKPGPHTITVEAEGYFPETLKQTAVEGRLIVVEVELKPKPALLRVRVEAGAEVSIDGRPAGTAPFARPLELAAGKHLVTVAKRGREAWTREVELARGQELSLDVSLRVTAQRKASYWVMGGAGAAFVGAGVYGVLALGSDERAEDLDDKRRAEGLSSAELDDYEAAVDERDARRGRTYLLLGVGGALAVTGALLYFIDTPRAEMPAAFSAGGDASVTFVPVLGGDSAGIGVVGRF